MVKYYPFHPSDEPRVFINLGKVAELQQVKQEEQQVTLGAACTLTVLIEEKIYSLYLQTIYLYILYASIVFPFFFFFV